MGRPCLTNPPAPILVLSSTIELDWTTPPPNTAGFVACLERKLNEDDPDVQGALNFCAAQIGIREPRFRARCFELGEAVGLYKDEIVPKNCTPNYLPELIKIEDSKLEA